MFVYNLVVDLLDYNLNNLHSTIQCVVLWENLMAFTAGVWGEKQLTILEVEPERQHAAVV